MDNIQENNEGHIYIYMHIFKYQVIQCDILNPQLEVTPLKGSPNSLSQKSKLTQNCQVRNDQTPKMFDDLTTKIGSPSVRSKSWMVKSSNLTSKFKRSVSASNQTIHLSVSVTPGVSRETSRSHTHPGFRRERIFCVRIFLGRKKDVEIPKCRKKLESTYFWYAPQTTGIPPIQEETSRGFFMQFPLRSFRVRYNPTWPSQIASPSPGFFLQGKK